MIQFNNKLSLLIECFNNEVFLYLYKKNQFLIYYDLKSYYKIFSYFSQFSQFNKFIKFNKFNKFSQNHH